MCTKSIGLHFAFTTYWASLLHRLWPRLWVLLHVLRKFLVAMNQAAASTLILAKIQLVKLVLEEARIEYVLRKRCLDVLKMVVTPVAAPIVA